MKQFKIAAAAITLVSVLSLSACANGKSHDETAGKTIPAVTDSALGQESSIQERHETDTAPENTGQPIPLLPSEESRNAGPSDIKEPAAIQILSPEEAAVIPEIPEYTYEEACQKGEVRQVRGTLPGAESGTWYIISLDGAEYYYGIYDFNPNAAGFLTPQSPESLVRLIFLRQIYFYILRTIVLCSIIYLYIIYRRPP